MANFRYKATDPHGRAVSGVIEAHSRDEVESLLLVEDLLLESVDVDEADLEFEARARKVSKGDVVALVEQLATLIRAGVPLASGLRAAGQEMISRPLRSTFIELADRLDSGSSLEDALKSCGPQFPAQLQGLILAGSRSGRLADLLGEYVRSANLGSEFRQLFWSTLAYPAFGLVLILGIVQFICSFSAKAIQSLTRNVADFGVQEPGYVLFLSRLAQLIADDGLLILLGVLAVLLLFWATIRITANPAQRRRLYCSIPVVGPILRFSSLAQFCHLLAMLIEADLPLPVALKLAGESVRDADVAEACGRIGQAVDEGEPLSTAVHRWNAIPAALGQLFRWSEDRRNLPESLRLAAEMFESRARSQASFASSVLSTFLLLLILWWIGFAIASIYLPMITLINLIGRLSG